MYIVKFTLCLIAIILVNSQRQYSEKDFINTEVDREINLKNKIIEIKTSVVTKCQAQEPINFYRYILSKSYSSSLIYIKFQMKAGKDLIPLTYEINNSNEDYVIYDINFNDAPLNPNEERKLKITEHYFERLQFYPKKILLKEDQNELYRDNLNYYSAYATKKQTVAVILPSERTSLIKYTMRGSNKSKDRIEYELKKAFEAFQTEPLYIHYLNNDPFMVMNHAYRTYRISHWGNIAVEDNYQLENIGALLDGEYSRIDFDPYGRSGGKNALNDLLASLPMKSNGLWYRDEIGNVSTSEAVREWDEVKLNLHPRFPILGGWKSNFDIGYNLPTKFHVKRGEANEYMVNLTFGMPFEDLMARDYKVKVVLPEGADNIRVHLPIDAEIELENDKEFGCLDLKGRNAVTIKVKNVYDRHKVHFQVFYTFSNFSLAFKPIILVVYFMIIFSTLIIYFRANLSLSRTDAKVKEE